MRRPMHARSVGARYSRRRARRRDRCTSTCRSVSRCCLRRSRLRSRVSMPRGRGHSHRRMVNTRLPISTGSRRNCAASSGACWSSGPTAGIRCLATPCTRSRRALDWPVLADPCLGPARGRAAVRQHHSRCGPAVARCHRRGGSRSRTHRALRRPADERGDQRLDGPPRHGGRVAGRSGQWIPRPAASCDSGAPGEFASILPATLEGDSRVRRARH